MRRHVETIRRAYTLIEVLIVVTIIGIASAVIVPHILDASTLGVQAAARMLIADLLYAQNEAVVQQTPHRIVIDTVNENYYLQKADENGDWPQPGDSDFKLRLNWRTTGDDLVDFTKDDRFEGVTIAKVTKSGTAWTFTEDSGTVTITFNELGAPDQGGVIGLVSAKDRYLVEIAPFTGKVTVRKP